ncbi:phosphotransferase [Actinokineospora pegani]|uniref:phosphotransferase n=1 Tax=Actinokineospora pegani TaxID=2654637 RepID=UPI0012E9B0D5|nr:phosphotransferase [Actinokineospora pegani]
MLNTPAVLDRCAAVFGPCVLIADRSTPQREALTLEVEAGDGVRWIAKQVRRDKKYREELTAYRDWVPALGASAPVLHSAHDDLRLLLLTRLPGEVVEGTAAERDPAVHRRVGELTRLLHDAAPPVLDEGFSVRLREKTARYARRAAGLLSAAEIGFVTGRVAALTDGAVPVVPCHGDNLPRNWLLGPTGEVLLIDFGHADRDHRASEAVKLWFRYWRADSGLADAFFDGYGLWPDELDRAVFTACAAHTSLSTVVWAREHDDTGFEAEARGWLDDLRR